MNKQQALEAMMRGEKVTHIYFTANEWMTIKDDRIVTEDGMKQRSPIFWSHRTESAWEDGYSIFNG